MFCTDGAIYNRLSLDCMEFAFDLFLHMTESPGMIDVFNVAQFTHKLCVVYNAFSVMSLLRGALF